MADVDLEFIARQNERVLTELRCVRDDLRVLSAIVKRHDHAMADLLDELHAIHQWMIGITELHKLEDQSST